MSEENAGARARKIRGLGGTETLSGRIRDALKEQIRGGTYAVGGCLPSEAALTKAFGVSRTVIREAIAGLKADGIVEPRQGSGVFVRQPKPQPVGDFLQLDPVRLSSVIEMLELRTAVEGDAAALAALRASPAQVERIAEALDEFRRHANDRLPTAEVDFAFHLAVAEAANNHRFRDFLRVLGTGMIPRRAVLNDREAVFSPDDHDRLLEEHRLILVAIESRDEETARAAMRRHLTNSQARYRAMLRSSAGGSSAGDWAKTSADGLK